MDSPTEVCQGHQRGDDEGYVLAAGGAPVKDGADSPSVTAMEGACTAGEKPGPELAGVETVYEGVGAAGLTAWAKSVVGNG